MNGNNSFRIRKRQNQLKLCLVIKQTWETYKESQKLHLVVTSGCKERWNQEDTPEVTYLFSCMVIPWIFTFLLKLSIKQIISRILFASSDLIIPVSKQENHHLALILWRKILKWWSQLLFSEKDNYTKETKGKQSTSQVKCIPELRHHSHCVVAAQRGSFQTVRETWVVRKWNSGISPHYTCPSSLSMKSLPPPQVRV